MSRYADTNSGFDAQIRNDSFLRENVPIPLLSLPFLYSFSRAIADRRRYITQILGVSGVRPRFSFQSQEGSSK
jgi:hypothetical protein